MSAQRDDIRFASDGVQCAGWFFRPEGAGPFPAVAMAHGMGATKSLYIEPFARCFAEAGIAVLLFDYRGYGASEGVVRERIDPAMQIEDYRNALTWLALHEAVDEHRLGVWGTSFSGGHVLHLGAYDPMVKVVVSQVGAMDILANAKQVLPEGTLEVQKQLIIVERKRGYVESAPAYLPLAAPDGQPALQPDTETYEWLMKGHAEVAQDWNNRVTLDSIERILQHAPALVIDLIAPKPLLMILATEDKWTPPELIRDAFARAGEPKQLIEIEGGHYAVYDGEGQHLAANAAAQFFGKHL